MYYATLDPATAVAGSFEYYRKDCFKGNLERLPHMKDKKSAILETQRLFAYEMTREDADAVYEMIVSHAEIAQAVAIDADALKSRDSFVTFIENYIRYQYGFYGYGIYTVYTADDEFVGLAGFWNGRKSGEGELGYIIKPQFRGLGYATEIAKEAASYALSEEIGFKSLIIRVSPDNEASKRVARKLCEAYAVEII